MHHQSTTHHPKSVSRRRLAQFATLTGAISIMAGAFGAHAVTGDPQRWLMTGGHYQLIHAVATLVALKWSAKILSPTLFLLGSWIFSGSLYAMALGGSRFLGAITPLGGLMLMSGWIILAFNLHSESLEEE